MGFHCHILSLIWDRIAYVSYFCCLDGPFAVLRDVILMFYLDGALLRFFPEVSSLFYLANLEWRTYCSSNVHRDLFHYVNS